MKVNENEEEERLVEEQHRERKRQLKRPAEERGSTGRRGPRRKELTNYRITLSKETIVSELERL